MGEAKRRRKLGLTPRSSTRQRRITLDLPVPVYDDLAEAHADAIKEHGDKTPETLSDFVIILLGLGLWGWRDLEEKRRKAAAQVVEAKVEIIPAGARLGGEVIIP